MKKEIRSTYIEREELFNKIMSSIRNELYNILKLDKHKKFKKYANNKGYIPLLSFHPRKKLYRFHCYVEDCPCNQRGLCLSEHRIIPKHSLHEFDGDNIIKQYCG